MAIKAAKNKNKNKKKKNKKTKKNNLLYDVWNTSFDDFVKVQCKYNQLA
jgi:hypothetical protein